MARPRTTPLPSIAELRAQFDYRPETGELIHKLRPDDGPYNLRFNRRYAGKPAGTVMNIGYLFVRPIGCNMMLGHRVAWAIHYGEWPVAEIDHKNGNKLDNSITNMRAATRTQNMRNAPKLGRTPYKGATYRRHCPNRPWEARMRINGKRVYLGSYATPELAAEAYARADREYSGEFAYTPSGKINATILFAVAD